MSASLLEVRPPRIRTSERTLFRRCRRLWAWQSQNRFNRTISGTVDHFWFGTGVHFALEDYHGYNFYGTPDTAFLAYVNATSEVGIVPATLSELRDMGIGLLQYYHTYWLRNRTALETYWVDDKPQVEVRFDIELPIKDYLGRPVVYHGTLDRVAADEYGRLWVVEYKTAKQFQVYHFDVDDQITSYCWAAHCIYQKPVAGVIYMQYRKKLPEYPHILANGKVSVNKTQNTTAIMYRQALLDIYGEVAKAPAENVKFLNNLISLETEDSDLFIRRDYVERNEYQIAAQGEKILLEAADMVNPELPLYPNPTRDCGWQCPLQSVCIAMDDGSDFESLLGSLTVDRQEDDRSWRLHLPHPDQIKRPELLSSLPQGEIPALMEEDNLLGWE
jgi:hypothetical protein